EGAAELRQPARREVRTLRAGQAAKIDVRGGIEVEQGAATGGFMRRMPLARKSGGQRGGWGELVVADPGENDDRWKLTSTGTFVDARFGIGLVQPSVQVQSHALSMHGVNDEGGSKVFSGVELAPGQYVVAFEMGNYSNAGFPPGMAAELCLADGSSLAD